MNTLPSFLAEAAPDALISGNWIIGVIGAIAAGIALVIGKRQGRAEAADNNVTLKHPVPTIHTQEAPEYVTMAIFNGHLKRIENSFAKIEEALDSERGVARIANGNVHKRIDALSEKMGERLGNLEGTLKGVAETTHTLLDIALGKKPPTHR